MPAKNPVSLIALAAGVLAVATLVVHACPYCPPTDATLSEKLADADTACIVRFLESKNGEQLSMQTTTFQIKQLMKPSNKFKVDDQIVVTFGVTANEGDTFLLMGQFKDDEMEWSLPIEIDEVSREYVRQAPSPEVAKVDRLAYFFRFLDVANPVMSNDAFGEFARSDFEDVKLLIEKLSRDKVRVKVRKWLADPNPQLVVRRAFYGMLLGLCGNNDDAEYLKREILAPIDEAKNRIDIGGIMGGYLLLSGPPGLQMLLKEKIDSLPPDLPLDDPRISDVDALRTTIRFLWDYCHDQFSEESLRAAMRRYLNRPESADLAIIDLARWKDWASLDQLIDDYGKEPWETETAKAKIVAFALSCRKDANSASGADLPVHAAKAQKFLDGLDPAFVQSVKRSMGGVLPTAKPSTKPKPTDNRSGSVDLLLWPLVVPVLFVVGIVCDVDFRSRCTMSYELASRSRDIGIRQSSSTHRT